MQGLVTKRSNKLKSREIADIFNKNDIIMFTETWTDNYTEIEVDKFTNFVLHRTEIKKSSKRNSGGIILYIRNEYVTNDTLVFKGIPLITLNTIYYICLLPF